MAYKPTEWKCGDTITAEKMNKLEQAVAQGGGGGTFFVGATVDGNDLTLDKTLGEIKEATYAGKQVAVRGDFEQGTGICVLTLFEFASDGGGIIHYPSANGRDLRLLASKDSDYPSTAQPK